MVKLLYCAVVKFFMKGRKRWIFSGDIGRRLGIKMASGGGFDMASLSPTVQAALNLAKKYPVQNQQAQEQQNNMTVWNSVKDFAQNAVNHLAPYTPTYYVGYGIGATQSTFNKLKDLYSAYKQNGATYAAQQYGEPSVKKAIKAFDWLTPLPISDVNKHQYVSCIGSTGGPLAITETIVGGIKKEIDDYKKKVKDPQLFKQYGGRMGILRDNFGDFVNDVKGAWKGVWSDSSEECEELLPVSYQNKRYY